MKGKETHLWFRAHFLPFSWKDLHEMSSGQLVKKEGISAGAKSSLKRLAQRLLYIQSNGGLVDARRRNRQERERRTPPRGDLVQGLMCVKPDFQTGSSSKQKLFEYTHQMPKMAYISLEVRIVPFTACCAL